MAEEAAAPPKKLVVFGATGGVGVEICKQALQQGHHVTAYVRNPEKLTVDNANLVKVQGQLTDAAKIEEAVRGKDAVLCALGSSSLLRLDTTCSVGTKAIIEAMDKESVKRLVVCSSYGVGPGNRTLLPWPIRTMLYYPLADKDVQEDIIIKSDTDYTVVRPPHLKDSPATGEIAVIEEGSLPGKAISRADVAAFMIKAAAEGSWIRKIVSISWKA